MSLADVSSASWIADGLREFGLPTIGLAVVVWLLVKATKAVWSVLQPRISQWFDRHITLIDSLIARNEKQDITDQAEALMLERIGRDQLSRRQACEMANHACDVVSAVVNRMEIEEAEEPLNRLRSCIERSKETYCES